MNRQKSAAFTLIELLVVMAVIGILVGMLLPAAQRVRETARRIECSNNLHQIGLALTAYHATNRKLPAGWMASDPNGEPGWGWAAVTLPYLDGGNLYKQFDLTVPIDDSTMAPLREKVIPTFICRSDPAPDLLDLAVHLDPHPFTLGPLPQHQHDTLIKVSKGNYSAMFGTTEVDLTPADGNGCFFENSRLRFKDLTDGLSKTILVGERRADIGTVTWVGVSPVVEHPYARIVGSAEHAPNDRQGHFEAFSSAHPMGANFLRADGSVQLLTDQVNLQVYHAMATRNGGEVVELPY